MHFFFAGYNIKIVWGYNYKEVKRRKIMTKAEAIQPQYIAILCGVQFVSWDRDRDMTMFVGLFCMVNGMII